MPHILKLSIWKITLASFINRKDASNKVLFDNILKVSTNQDNGLSAFCEEYLKSFGNRFSENKAGNKSFAPKPAEIKLNFAKNLISGFIEGGITGMDQQIKPNGNSKKAPVKVNSDEVVAQDHYFHLWLPPDVNYGYIMIQSYQGAHGGISNPFFEHLDLFLRKFDFHIRGKSPRVPNPIADKFRKHAVIVGLDIIKEKTSEPARNNLNPALAGEEHMRFVFSMSGFKYSYAEFMSKFKMNNKGNPFFIDLSEIGLTDPNDYITKIKYKDPETGAQTTADLTDLMNIRPSIIIPETVKIGGQQKPDLNKIHLFCNKQLTQLQKEDNYSTEDEFTN